MRKSNRDWIVERTATLLKTSGYLRTPLSEIMQVTGLQKGGLYHHFESRDELALAAFRHSANEIGEGLLARLEGEKSARRRLEIMVRYPLETYWKGGCPVGNLAVEADDSHRELAKAARKAMDWMIALFEGTIREGVKGGELGKVDARREAIRMVSAIEGGILLANLYKDPAYLEGIVTGLERGIRSGLR
ncbi:MAG TPA: TetR/AcrR family transcriptional regulator [Usitatibacter sp.]|nr:TetR/AcrR family transcriptional regulator [Usitatibacter sp.]